MNHGALIVALMTLLAGCATSASGPKFQDTSFASQPVADGKGRIILYRQSDSNFRAATIAIDGSIVGAVGHRQFLVADVAPGDHTVSAWARYTGTGEYSIDITVSPGETYYIRASRRPERSAQAAAGAAVLVFLVVDRKGHFKLEPVPAPIALIDLEEINLSQ